MELCLPGMTVYEEKYELDKRRLYFEEKIKTTVAAIG